MLRDLIPQLLRLRALRGGRQRQHALRRKAHRLTHEALERADEQARREQHEHTEGDLRGDQRVHHAA
jgi:hypothetical protein